MPNPARRAWPTRPRVLLAGAMVAALLLPALPGPLAGVGREAWQDPSAGPFRDDPAGLWALFVLNLNDRRCSNWLMGLGDLDIAKALRDRLVAQGVPASQVTILLDKGDYGFAAASEANVRAWTQTVAPLANAREDSRVLVMLAGHGVPYTIGKGGLFSRPAGSSICLNGGQEMLDYELGEYLSRFGGHVQVAVAASCSFCGGFADRLVGPADTVGTATVGGVNRLVAVGCGMATECTGDVESGSMFLHLWADAILTGAADGWTRLARDDTALPYDSRARDGRVTFEEAYWHALSRVPVGYPESLAVAQRFQVRDSLAGGFTLTRGGAQSAVSEGTGNCAPDLRDYDGDGLPNTVDVLNRAKESLARVPAGGYVVTNAATSSAFRLVVTSPSGNTVTFQGGQTNMSLDSFIGEPMDGTWVFDQRASGPINHVLSAQLGGKTMKNAHPRATTDLGVLLWNWHADSRTDESLVLDVDPCGWTGVRLYQSATPEGIA